MAKANFKLTHYPGLWEVGVRRGDQHTRLRSRTGGGRPLEGWVCKGHIRQLDCYVLDDGTRVLSSGSTTKAIAEVDRGSLQDYVGQKALKPFIDSDKILQETIRFRIPGTQWPGLGITTAHFELAFIPLTQV